MDKYEFNIKVEQIKKVVNKGDYETAMKIADTIDWRRVRNANLLSMIAQVYEKNSEYQEAKEILLLAFERAPVGKRLLYKLAELAIKGGDIREAEDYYREFCEMAADDPRQHLLRYMILKAKKAPADQLLQALERYTSTELDEKWMYELAELYRAAGREDDCVRTCDRIMLMFGVGKYVDKAMELKLQYAPLTNYQMDLVENRDKYEAKLRAVEQKYNGTARSLDLYGEETAAAYQPEETVQPESYELKSEKLAAEKAAMEREVAKETAASQEPERMFVEKEEREPVYETIRRPVQEPTEEELRASIHQAEIENALAEELSRISIEDCSEPERPLEQTKVLHDIRSILPGMEESKRIPVQETSAVSEVVSAPEEPVFEEKRVVPEKSAVPAGQSYDMESAAREAAVFAAYEDDEEDLQPIHNHLMIEAITPEKGLEMAVEALRKIHRETGTKNPVVKITGSRLSKRGIAKSADKLVGKDLIIEEAGDLSEVALDELCELIKYDESGMLVVLVDNPKQMEDLHRSNPELAEMFECIGVQPVQKQIPLPAAPMPSNVSDPVSFAEDQMPKAETVQRRTVSQDEEMDLDEFAEYACQYAEEIDCSISGKSMLALYERIEIMEEDGIPLTKANAEEVIEEAADRAEKPSFGRRITGMFAPKYDKDGLLILREEHFME